MKSTKPGRSKGCKLHSVRRADLETETMNLPDLPWSPRDTIRLRNKTPYMD